jgi:uncharacterized membrane protein
MRLEVYIESVSVLDCLSINRPWDGYSSKWRNIKGGAHFMVIRLIFSAIVLLLFTALFMKKLSRESKEQGRVSKWSIFFLVLAAVLWIALILTIFGMAM